MKKFLVSSLLVVSIISMSGCGSSSNKDKIDLDNAKVEFKNSAKYDLSEYMYPASSQTNNYVSKMYKDKSGKRKYKKDPDNTKYASLRYDINGSKIIEVDENSTTVNELLSDRVKTIVTYNDDNTTEESQGARFADIGDYIVKRDLTLPEGSSKIVVRLIKHLDSKTVNSKTYNDIIEIEALARTIITVSTQGSSVTSTTTSKGTEYYAKEVGSIESTKDECEEFKSSNGLQETICKKDVTTITTINK